MPVEGAGMLLSGSVSYVTSRWGPVMRSLISIAVALCH